ncbi:MAG: toxin [Desulfuromonadaceae bacterium]
MKAFNWNTEKNIQLKLERDISFEEVLAAMSHGALLDVVSHPNSMKYPNQRVFVVRIRNYVYLVPFVETANELFLKTIIPSRVATKKYLPEGFKNEK